MGGNNVLKAQLQFVQNKRGQYISPHFARDWPLEPRTPLTLPVTVGSEGFVEFALRSSSMPKVSLLICFGPSFFLPLCGLHFPALLRIMVCGEGTSKEYSACMTA